MEKNMKKKNVSVYIIESLCCTKHCKSTILQKKKKKVVSFGELLETPGPHWADHTSFRHEEVSVTPKFSSN